MSSVVGRQVADLVVGHVQGLVDKAPQVPVAQAVDHPAPLLAGGHQSAGISVKADYQLTANPAEAAALSEMLDTCGT